MFIHWSSPSLLESSEKCDKTEWAIAGTDKSCWGFPCSEGALQPKRVASPLALSLSCMCSLVGKMLMGLVVKRERFGLELKYDVPINSRSKLKLEEGICESRRHCCILMHEMKQWHGWSQGVPDFSRASYPHTGSLFETSVIINHAPKVKHLCKC